jgi:prepilin-type N-terminal cleavage/methylation domain-containing protein
MKKGFTLIELLVVISIITILLSVLLPCLAATRQECKTVVCKMNLYDIGVQADIYFSEYEKYIWQKDWIDIIHHYNGYEKDYFGTVFDCPTGKNDINYRTDYTYVNCRLIYTPIVTSYFSRSVVLADGFIKKGDHFDTGWYPIVYRHRTNKSNLLFLDNSVGYVIE